MITKLNESKILSKHFSWNGRKSKSKQKWNGDKCQCDHRRQIIHHIYREDYTYNPSIFACNYYYYVYLHSNYIYIKLLLMPQQLRVMKL